MTSKHARRLVPAALLVAAAFGAAPLFAQNAPPVSIAASDKPMDAAVWAALPIDDLRQRAKTNEVAAMEELGRRLISGIGVPRDDASGAAWFQRAADAGSSNAAYVIAVCYERGIGVSRDARKAVDWYRKAAAADLPAAKHNLGLMLRDGRGAPQDGPQALELLRASARLGMTASMFTLGDMYERGNAVLKDPAAALAWFAIANELELQSNNGAETPFSRSARARAEAIERVMTGADRERASEIGKVELKQIVTALAPRTRLELPPRAATAATSGAPPTASPPAPATVDPTPANVWPAAAIDQVKLVQQALIDLHRLGGKADGAAGPATRTAIRDFEKSAGLAETGQPSLEVYDALSKALAKPEAPAGATDAWPANGVDQIRVIQRLLADLKLLAAEPTGTVGPQTRRAIRDYQRKAGLKETGEPSQALFDSLKSARGKAGG